MDRDIIIAELIGAFVIGIIFSGVSVFILWSVLCSERVKRVEAEARAETLEQLHDAREWGSSRWTLSRCKEEKNDQ